MCWPRWSKPMKTAHWPIEAPNAVEAVRFIMEQNDLRQIDLAKHFGNRQRVSEFSEL